MALLPPIKPTTTPQAEKNIVTFEPGPPNEYFDGDLSNWTVSVLNGNPTAEIDSGALLLDIPDVDPGTIRVMYNYLLPSEDFDTIIDVSDYSPDNINDGINVGLRIYSEDLTNLVRVGFFQDTATRWRVSGYAYFNESVVEDTWVNSDTYRPTKLRIKRIENVFYYYYYWNNVWVQITSYDAGVYAINIKKPLLTAYPRAGYGGSVKFDNLAIIPATSYFPNDTFENLNNWVIGAGVNASVTIDSGKLLLDLDDGYDTYAVAGNKYSIPQGDFTLSVDLLDYSPDHADGFITFLEVGSSNTGLNLFRIRVSSNPYRVRVYYYINGVGETVGNYNDLGNYPNKIRIVRIGTFLYAYYYDTGWHLIDSVDYGSYSEDIFKSRLTAYDINNHGGSIKLDNLTLDRGADSYNLYWKKDKCPNCYFNDLDDWIEYTEIGTEISSIVSNKARLDIPDGSSYSIAEIYNFPLKLQDFMVSIDISNYTPDNTTDGFKVHLRICQQESHPWTWNYFDIHFNQSGVSQYTIDCTWKIDGVENNTGSIIVGSIPSKLRVARVTTRLYGYYYIDSWVQFGFADFSGHCVNLLSPTIFINDTNNRGGSVDFDNLIKTPSVKDSGTKISDIIDLTYDHESLTTGDVYCYEVTANGSESEASEETYGVPIAGTPSPPSGISIVSGEELNTITFTADLEADETHVYWDTSPGFTPSEEQKLSDVTSPKEHTELNPSLIYYYILVSENEHGEGDYSNEYSSSPIPGVPENLTIVPGVEKNTITFDSVIGADSYNIYWKNSSPVTKLNGTKITGVTSPHEHTSLTPGIELFYVVAAVDEDGESNVSGEQSEIPLLPAPTSHSATASGDREITIAWSSVSGASFYNIYWRKTSGVTKENGTKIAMVESPHIHSDLIPNDEYFYVITAQNSNDESADSSEISDIVELGSVVVLSVEVRDSETVLTWIEKLAVDSYNIYYGNLPNVTIETGIKITGVTSPYNHEELEKQLYYYIMVPVIDGIEYTASSEHSATIKYEGKVFNHDEAAQNEMFYQYSSVED